MILVAGSANLDFVVRAARIPAPGETVLGRAFETFPGGKGANQALACARCGGVSTAMLLALGEDDFAKPLIASLQHGGVQLHIARSSKPTGTAFICVSDEGENAITVAPGANEDLLPAHWPRPWPAGQAPISHLLMQLESPLASVLAFAQAARAQGAKVVLNAAPARNLPAPLLAAIDTLMVNQGELAHLAQGEDGQTIEAQIRRLGQRMPDAQIIVTLGAQGCIAWQGDALLRCAAYPVEVIDSTGAGDTFCGTWVAAQARGLTMLDSLKEASAASALACTKLGAQSSIPTREAVLALLRTHS